MPESVSVTVPESVSVTVAKPPATSRFRSSARRTLPAGVRGNSSAGTGSTYAAVSLSRVYSAAFTSVAIRSSSAAPRLTKNTASSSVPRSVCGIPQAATSPCRTPSTAMAVSSTSWQ